MAQTSIEWLENELHGFIHPEHGKDFLPIIEQAKEKHKEETMDAFQAGKWDGYENKVCGAKQFKDPAEYYNETFNK
jgi:hypothetical protein